MGGADDDLAVLRVDRGGLGEEAWGPIYQGAGAVPGILGWDRQIDGPALDRGRVDRGDQFDRALAVFAVDQRGSSVTDRGDHIAQLPGVAGVLEPGLLLGQGVELGDQRSEIGRASCRERGWRRVAARA